jgi:hypothetical protein
MIGIQRDGKSHFTGRFARMYTNLNYASKDDNTRLRHF